MDCQIRGGALPSQTMSLGHFQKGGSAKFVGSPILGALLKGMASRNPLIITVPSIFGGGEVITEASDLGMLVVIWRTTT